MKYLMNWFEIPALDIKQAVAFYNAVLNLQLSIIDCGDEKMACFPNVNGLSGAISVAPGFLPSKHGIQITFHVGNDCTDAIQRAITAGGTLVRPKTKIEVEGRGYFALVSDTEGNVIGLYSDN